MTKKMEIVNATLTKRFTIAMYFIFSSPWKNHSGNRILPGTDRKVKNIINAFCLITGINNVNTAKMAKQTLDSNTFDQNTFVKIRDSTATLSLFFDTSRVAE